MMLPHMKMGRWRWFSAIACSAAILCFLYLYSQTSLHGATLTWHGQHEDSEDIGDVELVIASTRNSNVSWVYNHFPGWKKSVYVVDDASAELTVMENKGNEAMVYLT
jgi:hypothetical protein